MKRREGEPNKTLMDCAHATFSLCLHRSLAFANGERPVKGIGEKSGDF